jgi:hypothetical protein
MSFLAAKTPSKKTTRPAEHMATAMPEIPTKMASTVECILSWLK